MPPVTSTGYAVNNLTELAAIPVSDRADKYTILVRTTGVGYLPAWYTYFEYSDSPSDAMSVIMPGDNPSYGRWHRAGTGGQGSASNWTIVDSYGSHTAVNEDKIMAVVFSDSTTINIGFINNPQLGNSFTVISNNATTTIELTNFNKYLGNSYYSRVYFQSAFQEIKFIYTGTGMGWITNRVDLVQFEASSGS